MTVQVAHAATTSRNLHIDIAFIALEWLDEKYDTQITPSYLDSWQQFNAAFLKKHKYEFGTLANTRIGFTHYMDVFEQNFD